MPKILLIDDDADFREILQEQLHKLGHQVQFLDSAEVGLRYVSENAVDLVLLDNLMPRMSGLEFLAVLKDRCHTAPLVILMTGAPDADTAIQATKLGAFGYVIKPTEYEAILPEMEPEINRALAIRRPVAPVLIPKPNEKENKGDPGMIGRSKQMLTIFLQIGQLESDESVLILGETGTGKDLAARAIHTNSPRKDHPFVAINCSALSPNLLESELFGHEKAAFTGADKMRKGYFEHARGGTLFLDEVGDMPHELQVKLLRVLQEREIVRMGSCEPIKVDVRVVAATSRDLKKLVVDGTFRKDLFYRLEGTTLRMPALRDRDKDVELLAKYFLNRLYSEELPPPPLHSDALQALRQHPWPGNIRQLENVMRRARKSIRSRHGSQILPEDLDFGELDSLQTSPAEPTSRESAVACLGRTIAWAWKNEERDVLPLLQAMLEKELLRYALTVDESQVQRARRLGIAKNTLYALLEKHKIDKAAQGE